MTLLWNIFLNGKKAGVVKSVKPLGFIGFYSKEDNEILVPCDNSVRDCLPHYWHKAFDRAPLGFWYGENYAHKTLYSKKGFNVLCRITAEPYQC